MNLKNHSTVALGYFLIIAFLGMLLRLFHVVDVPVNFKHIVHAHSHIALLGWIYTALTTLIYYAYLRENPISKKYKRLFFLTQFTLIGMLISFPITGYALFSILFSTLFLFASYWFFWFVNKHISPAQKFSNSFKLVKAGLWFMIISSLGPWALGIIMNTLEGASIWYRISIYFYLHFQYNGWFIVALFGIFFYILEQHNVEVSKKLFNKFYWLLLSSIILTFSLSVLWTKPYAMFYTIGTIGSLLQLISFWWFVKILKPIRLSSIFSKQIFNLLTLVGLLFIIKMSLQLVGSIPFFADSIATNLDLVIGYLHWTFLGVVSILLLGFLHYYKLIRLSKKSMSLYIIGFFLTEVLIFYKGYIQWKKGNLSENFDLYLAIASFFLLISIVLIFWIQLKTKLLKTVKSPKIS
ncbi:MAG: hypothetical protein QM478_02270 [Flavobacteriaceae bacterium]